MYDVPPTGPSDLSTVTTIDSENKQDVATRSEGIRRPERSEPRGVWGGPVPQETRLYEGFKDIRNPRSLDLGNHLYHHICCHK
jgi:hypothetical protein